LRRLILMRHARAERATLDGEDLDRILTEGGRGDAALVARALSDTGAAPSRVLVSSAVRSRQTWEAMSPVFPQTESIESSALYLADAGEILREIEAESDADTLMVIAHNPGIYALAVQLLQWSSAPSSVTARFQNGYPTSTASIFEIDEGGRANFDGMVLAADHGGGGGE
jgi:phosphohistidine phosphatase